MAPAQLQLTLAIFKPDITRIPLFVEAVRARLLQSGFLLPRSRQLTLSRERAELFYAEHRGRFFHRRLVTFMSSGPIWAHVLAREDAITAWRHLMGPTKVFRAVYERPDSLRARYGLTDTRNGLHGSDSPESAAREIGFFFPEFDQSGWLAQREPQLERRVRSRVDRALSTSPRDVIGDARPDDVTDSSCWPGDVTDSSCQRRL
ncbi:nucleoside diphosphate kinase 6-like [Pollicipes pollicipes]|uniref:nucleoside diphosphate kinase 6-like n=1 Tax=Pollicipes pollicipes TaxID=41117 RepID=UPI001885A0A3|nr:nucleoside diphosphate kinase 6-like [Pollicipes pollicipes]XP_037070932.1 nucleoside diphosphate kinase 6-like [Pollicipes pollicipes]XP_037070941.1 nucleoside diphosphate kinase 6-like [Pollicipes pollicipes]XP_037070950.1 nucleoside diphosphate kinase 6-like [Pollicipes pollicipes]